MPYEFETGNVGHVGELIVKQIDSWVYPTVERDFRHEAAYVAWNANHPRATLSSCQKEIDGYLSRVRENECRTGGGDGNQDNCGSQAVSELVANHFREEGRMVPRTDVELSTACQAIIVNENHLRAECPNKERENYRRERDESVGRNAAYEGQVKTLTTQVTLLRNIGSNADTKSGKEVDSMGTKITTLTRDKAVLKGRLATSEAAVIRLRKRSDGESARSTRFQNDLETSTAEVERLNGELTTARVDLTTALTELATAVMISIGVLIWKKFNDW